MTYLLDINVLVALSHQGHSDHERVSRWYAQCPPAETRLGTCSITELGFVRVSVQVGFETRVGDAVETLRGIQVSSRIPFDRLVDDLGAAELPPYVQGPKQIADGHLWGLARRHRARLVTLDRGIPDAVVIP